jgi:alpha-D-ribose 1-methylphosphonate 5-triphosphate synthase subunit PhnH
MTGIDAAAGLDPGFDDPVRDAQACFRAVLDATAHPGRIIELRGDGLPAAPGLCPAAVAIALTLCDGDTPVWLDALAAAAVPYLAFHCGAPVAALLADAAFAFAAEAAELPPLDAFSLGSDEYPERAATLVVEVAGLAAGTGAVLRGPGIVDEARLAVTGLPGRFWAERRALSALFPRGLDVIFVCGRALAALPRSTQVMV